jgi:hypothetical protein
MSRILKCNGNVLITLRPTHMLVGQPSLVCLPALIASTNSSESLPSSSLVLAVVIRARSALLGMIEVDPALWGGVMKR